MVFYPFPPLAQDDVSPSSSSGSVAERSGTINTPQQEDGRTMSRQGSAGVVVLCAELVDSMLLLVVWYVLTDSALEQLRGQQCKERAKIVLWKKPVTTIHYFIRELFIEAKKLTLGLVFPSPHLHSSLSPLHLSSESLPSPLPLPLLSLTSPLPPPLSHLPCCLIPCSTLTSPLPLPPPLSHLPCSTLQHRVKVAVFVVVLTVLLLLYFIDGPLNPVSLLASHSLRHALRW